MVDRYQSFTQSAPGAFLSRRLGLPQPPVLRRFTTGAPLVEGPVRTGAAPGGRLSSAIGSILDDVGAPQESDDVAVTAGERRYGGLVFDATGITSSEHLRALYDFFHPVMRAVRRSGRVVVFGTPPEVAGSVEEAVAQRAVEGFVRAVGKEIRGGSTAQLVYVAPGAEGRIGSTLRFLLSGRSAYVSGQIIRVGTATGDGDTTGISGAGRDHDRPLDGRVILVTGAARGIGAATAEVLGRDGAHVICLDLPGDGEELAKVAAAVGGTSVGLDITSDDAPGKLVEHVRSRHGALHAVVHNAGITRDKTLAKMTEAQWDQTIAVNLRAPERLTRALVDADAIARGGAVVGFSSIAGIAGNVGQTNYATSKAGVIGFVEFWAPRLAEHDITVNAVAPGFIDTRMTEAMPVVTREVSRRMNSLQQAGLPVDVAETVGWFVDPGSAAVTGNVVRVCGQMLLGA
jgi:3-oxoacyl-[acyl-carrier protein] reductase